MEKWLLWTLISVGAVIVVGIVTWIILESTGSDPSYICGGGKYDPNTEECVHGKVCKKANVCGSGGMKSCIDPDTQTCVSGTPCDIANVCQDSDGNTICIDPDTQTCMSDGTVCATKAVCDDECIDLDVYNCLPGGKCKKDKTCDDNCCGQYQECGSNGKCISCTTDLCEGGRTCCDTDAGEKCINDKCCIPCGDKQECCPDGQQCITLADGSSVCCDPGQICLDSDGNQVCCTGKCCNGVCCADGDKCVNGTCCAASKACDDGTCCDNDCCGGQCCGNGTQCHNGQCMTACGDDFCDPVSQICDEISTTGKKYCVNQGCIWQGIVYDPSDMRDNTGVGDIPVCGYNGKYYTCRDPTGVSTDKLTRIVTDIQDPTSTTDCGVNDCDYRFSEKGLVDAQWDSSSKTCTGSFDCDNSLPVCGDCPVSGDDSTRCCMNSDGTYSGQLCPQNSVCDNGTCYAGYYCGKNSDGFPVCIGTTDHSKATYQTLSACRAAGCRFQPADCYYDDVKDFVDSHSSAMKSGVYYDYIWIAVYGMKSSNCVTHSDHVNWEGEQQAGNPWIGLWKRSKDGYAIHYYFCTENEYDGKTYYFDVRNAKGTNITNTPTLEKVIYRDASCSSCSSPPSGNDVTGNFTFKGYKGVYDGYGNGTPAIAIIVPKEGTSCLSSSTTTDYQLLPVTRWNPAGVF